MGLSKDQEVHCFPKGSLSQPDTSYGFQTILQEREAIQLLLRQILYNEVVPINSGYPGHGLGQNYNLVSSDKDLANKDLLNLGWP